MAVVTWQKQTLRMDRAYIGGKPTRYAVRRLERIHGTYWEAIDMSNNDAWQSLKTWISESAARQYVEKLLSPGDSSEGR